MSKQEAAQTYLKLAAPVNTAVASWKKTVTGWTNSTTTKTAADETQPLIDAYKTGLAGLVKLAAAYAPAADDIKDLVKADWTLVGDLQGIATLTVLNSGSWQQELARDGEASSADLAIVRSDLGLPPKS